MSLSRFPILSRVPRLLSTSRLLLFADAAYFSQRPPFGRVLRLPQWQGHSVRVTLAAVPAASTPPPLPPSQSSGPFDFSVLSNRSFPELLRDLGVSPDSLK